MSALTRREFIQLPFGLLMKEKREQFETEEIMRAIQVVSTHSHLRDQALMGLINEIFRKLELPVAELGQYGTIYREE